MIKGNAYDTYEVMFSNGEKFCLMATSKTAAWFMAAELNPEPTIVNVQKQDEWIEEQTKEWTNEDN
jgi:hypothetical protein